MNSINRWIAFLTFLWLAFTSIIGTHYTWKWFSIADLSPLMLIVLLFLAFIIVYGLIRTGKIVVNFPSKYFWIVLFTVFIIVKVLWIISVPTVQQSDFANYHKAAIDIALGRGLFAWAGLNGWIWPLFLGFLYSIFGASELVGIICSLLLDIASLFLLCKVVQEFADESAMRWTALLFTIWPDQVFFTSLLGTEHITLTLVLAGLLFSMRIFTKKGNIYRNAVLVGFFFALSYLSRPAAIAYLGGVLLFLLIRKETNRSFIAAVAVITGVFFTVNIVYNSSLRLLNPGGLPDTMNSIGVNMLFGSNFKSKGMWNPDDADLKTYVLNYPGAYKEMLRISWERYISYTPKQLVKLLISKGWIFWNQPFDAYYWATNSVAPGGIYDLVPEALKKFLFNSQFYFQAFLLLLASIGAYRVYYHYSSPILVVVLWVILLATLIHVVLVTTSRYHFIFQSLVVISGAVALAYPKFNQKTEPSSIGVGISRSPAESYALNRIRHWNEIASEFNPESSWGQFYHQRLAEIYRFLVPPNQRVLELGCAQGDLLASLKPSYGVGVDFSSKMIELARKKHPELKFVLGDVSSLKLDETFDVIILSDLINDLWDVQACFEALNSLCNKHTRVIINFYSRVWGPILTIAGSSGLSIPNLTQNWLTAEDVSNILKLAGFEVLRSWQEVLLPVPFPLLDKFMNRFLVRIYPFNLLAISNFLVAYPQPKSVEEREPPVVSVVVPARNEAGNIPDIFDRVPEMGKSTEIVFVEGHSRDNTYQVIVDEIENHPERRCKLIKQTGVGKGDAVRLGFQHATGDILMILDADLTVPPEELTRFYTALLNGKGELINGVRLVYPMEKQAMRLFNFLGNKFFSLAFTWVLGQPVKDTLCGTKVLWKRDYILLAENRGYFGDFDPFGDFDLLFGAARMNLKITDLPIRYRERKYGTTNIQRWKHGWLLLKMLFYAAFRLKFI